MNYATARVYVFEQNVNTRLSIGIY